MWGGGERQARGRNGGNGIHAKTRGAFPRNGVKRVGSFVRTARTREFSHVDRGPHAAPLQPAEVRISRLTSMPATDVPIPRPTPLT